MISLKHSVKRVIERLLEPWGHTIAPIPFGGLGYLNCEQATREAARLGKTIPE
jgi:hypothetical protein